MADLLFLTDSDLRALWHGFKTLRKRRGDKKIRVLDLLRKADISPTPFSYRVFEIADLAGKKQVDFHDFIVSTWNYCTLSRDGLIEFAWDVLRSENNGEVELTDLRQLIEEVLGSTMGQASREFVNEAVARSPHIGVTGRQFYLLAIRDAEMLAPAYWLQEHMRSLVASYGFWRMATEKRAMFLNNQAWKDLVKQLNPLGRAEPGSLPAVSGTIAVKKTADMLGSGAGASAPKEGKMLGSAGGVPTMKPGGMAALAVKGPGGDKKTRRGSAMMQIQRQGRSTRQLDGDGGAAGGGAAGGGTSTVQEARALILGAGASAAAESKAGGPSSSSGDAKPMRSEVAKYLLPDVRMVHVANAGTGGYYPNNPEAAESMQMGLDSQTALQLANPPDDAIKGYYRRARKHNLPQYVLHTDNNSDAAQFSIPGVVDGVRGRWRHARVRVDRTDKMNGLVRARGGGYFSGMPCSSSNAELDGRFDAEIVRIPPSSAKATQDFLRKRGLASRAGDRAEEKDKEKGKPSTASVFRMPQAARVLAGMQGQSAAPSVAAPGEPVRDLPTYGTLREQHRELELRMREEEDAAMDRQDAALDALDEVDEEERAAEAKRRAKMRPGRLAAVQEEAGDEIKAKMAAEAHSKAGGGGSGAAASIKTD